MESFLPVWMLWNCTPGNTGITKMTICWNQWYIFMGLLEEEYIFEAVEEVLSKMSAKHWDSGLMKMKILSRSLQERIRYKVLCCKKACPKNCARSLKSDNSCHQFFLISEFFCFLLTHSSYIFFSLSKRLIFLNTFFFFTIIKRKHTQIRTKNFTLYHTVQLIKNWSLKIWRYNFVSSVKVWKWKPLGFFFFLFSTRLYSTRSFSLAYEKRSTLSKWDISF